MAAAAHSAFIIFLGSTAGNECYYATGTYKVGGTSFEQVAPDRREGMRPGKL
jgi:hypothetical protein